LPEIVWLEPTMLAVRLHDPVPEASVIVQEPPAPLTLTLPVGVPWLPDTVAVIVEPPPTVTVVGLADNVTVAPVVVTVNCVVPLADVYFASPL
jgi:hypothetical protein